MNLFVFILPPLSYYGQSTVNGGATLLSPGYFGNVQSSGSPASGYFLDFYGANTWYNNQAVTVYTCPETGLRTLSSLGFWAKTRGAPHGTARMALYDTDLNLLCQWNSGVLINSTTEQWWESSGLSGSTEIYGGSSYLIAVTIDSALISFGQTSATNATKNTGVAYTGGFPDPIGAGTATTVKPVVRAYVTGGYGTGSPPPPPTVEIYYVDPSMSGSSQDGTSANPYLSLNAAITARCNKTFTLPIQIRCRTSGNIADTTRVQTGPLNQWDSNNANYLQIVAEIGHRASAAWDSTKYHLYTTFASGAGAGSVLEFSRANINVDGIQIGMSSQSGQNAACEYVYWSVGQSGLMSNCIIRGTNATGLTRGMSSINGINVYNTVICDLGSNIGSAGVKNHGDSKFYNCTVIGGSGVGIDFVDGASIAKNCYLQSDTASILDTGNVTMTTVATSDALGSLNLRNIAHTTANFVSVTTGDSDYHLVSGSALRSGGTDTSSDASPFNFTTDIDSGIRSAWDIGADEF